MFERHFDWKNSEWPDRAAPNFCAIFAAFDVNKFHFNFHHCSGRATVICCKNSNFRAKLNKTMHNRVFSLFSAFSNANCAHRRATSSSRRTAAGRTARMRHFRAKAAQFCAFSLFSAFFTANNAHWRAQPPSRRTAAGQTARTRHFWAKPRISAFFRTFPRFSPQIVRVGGRILHPAAQPQGGRRERAFFLAKTAQFRVFSLFSAHYADSPVQNVLFRTFYRSTGRHQFLRIID